MKIKCLRDIPIYVWELRKIQVSRDRMRIGYTHCAATARQHYADWPTMLKSYSLTLTLPHANGRDADFTRVAVTKKNDVPSLSLFAYTACSPQGRSCSHTALSHSILST